MLLDCFIQVSQDTVMKNMEVSLNSINRYLTN